MPAELAAGPRSLERDDVAEWDAACEKWSLANGLSWNGYARLLPPEWRDGGIRWRLARLEGRENVDVGPGYPAYEALQAEREAMGL